ncbi:hypothetical protein HK405_002710, partial [Cladochytrium tenue]
FRTWLDTRLNQCAPDLAELLLPDEVAALTDAAGPGANVTALEKLKTLLATPSWHTDDAVSAALKPILTRLCSRYLLIEKRKSFALDPV